MPLLELETATERRTPRAAASGHPDVLVPGPADRAAHDAPAPPRQARDLFRGRRYRGALLVRALLTASLFATGLAVVTPPLMGRPHGLAQVLPASGVLGISTTTGATAPATDPAATPVGATAPAIGLISPMPAVVAAPPVAVAPTVAAGTPPQVKASTTTTGPRPGAAGAVPAPSPCVPAFMRLALTANPAPAPGVITVRGVLTNISGRACTSYGDDWRVDFSRITAPAQALYGSGGGAATSTGKVIAAGATESASWAWNGQDCSVTPCAQVPAGTYAAAVTWNGVNASARFTLP